MGRQKKSHQLDFFAYIDVRDLGKAHLLAYEKQEAANQRFLVYGKSFVYEQFIAIIRKKFPEYKDTTPVVDSFPSFPSDTYRLDNSKAKTQLGLTFHTMEETVVDTVKSLQELIKQFE